MSRLIYGRLSSEAFRGIQYPAVMGLVTEEWLNVGRAQRLLMIANMSCSTRARRLIWARDMGRDTVGV
ncbi:hypothetical protein COMA2_70138 [Candidatus Nitrospira nitrificans]|uniref:Uncharacterized protein n=1 Tax=Candidatus Nitrospira nitrificans TaxID=1742973 RepID=A0A0S4LTT8_9BACT|nr:hypothetical protein COMA2_70138 [Candidatus Nitrospira nitrificans]